MASDKRPAHKSLAGTSAAAPAMSAAESGFAALVRTEIRRAARTRGALSLALFRADRLEPDTPRLLDSIAQCVALSMRETDVSAVLGERSVAVLLVETDDAGAHAFVRKIQRKIPLPGVASEVHTYPSPVFDEVCASAMPARNLILIDMPGNDPR